MKQWITEDQFNELADEQKTVWLDWIKERGYTFAKIYPESRTFGWMTLNFPSIGEMIEFLADNHKQYDGITYKDDDGKLYIEPRYINGWKIETLCDELWEAVKEILNNDNKITSNSNKIE